MEPTWHRSSFCGFTSRRFLDLERKSVLFLFVDGLGVGSGDNGANPFVGFQPQVLRLRSEALGPFPRGGICIPTDAGLGVDGVPQSATGQTTLFTGVNAAQQIGRHLQGFPNFSLKTLIAQESLFQRMRRAGFHITFANAFTPKFFRKRPRWVSVTTVMSETAGVGLRDLSSPSLFMDFSNRFLRERGLSVPVRTPQIAARILADLTYAHDLCLYEYFLTDLEGHRGSFDSAVRLLSELDLFLVSVVESLDFSRASLVIASDHGNIEDMSHRHHTVNPVPTLLWGDIQEVFLPFASGLRLEQITPLIAEFFGISQSKT